MRSSPGMCAVMQNRRSNDRTSSAWISAARFTHSPIKCLSSELCHRIPSLSSWKYFNLRIRAHAYARSWMGYFVFIYTKGRMQGCGFSCSQVSLSICCFEEQDRRVYTKLPFTKLQCKSQLQQILLFTAEPAPEIPDFSTFGKAV